MNEEELLFRTWGEYLKYPQCCVDEFVNRVMDGGAFPYYMNESIFDGCGYVPCGSCHEKTLGLTKEEAILWLGRNPFEEKRGQLESFKSTYKKTQCKDFKVVSDKHGLALDGYQEWLMSNICMLEGKR